MQVAARFATRLIVVAMLATCGSAQWQRLVREANERVNAGEGERVLPQLEQTLAATDGVGALALAALASRIHHRADRWARVFAVLSEATQRAPGPYTSARADAEGCDPQWYAYAASSFLTERATRYLDIGRTDLAAADIQAAMPLASAPAKASLQLLDVNRLLLSGRYDDAARAVEPLLDHQHLSAPQRRLAALTQAIAIGRTNTAVAEARRRLARLQAEVPKANAQLRRGIAVAAARLALRSSDPSAARAALVDGGLAPDAPAGDANLLVLQTLLLFAEDRADDATYRQWLDALLAAFERELARWSYVPVTAGGIGFLQLAARRDLIVCLMRMHRLVHGTDGAAQRLAYVARAQSMGTLARRLGADEHRWHPESMPDNGGMLIYVPGNVGVDVLALDREGIREFELAPDLGIPQLVATLRTSLLRVDSPMPSAAVDAGTRLRQRLLPTDLLDEIATWRTVGIIGRDLLENLPFEALPSHTAASLGCELALYYPPSLPVATLLGERKYAQAERDLSLLYCRHPARNDVPALPPRSFDLPAFAPFEPEAGSTRTLADPKVSTSRSLLILAHGIADFGRDRPAGIAMEDRDLWCEDLERSTLPQLVVLAVCNAAMGASRPGDAGAHHLGGAALLAGARVVALADQDLDLRFVEQLLPAFFAALADGSSPAEAMLQARRQVARQAQFAHPGMHATLRLEGLAATPIQWTGAPTARHRWLAAIGAGLAVLAAIVFAAARRRSRPRHHP